MVSVFFFFFPLRWNSNMKVITTAKLVQIPVLHLDHYWFGFFFGPPYAAFRILNLQGSLDWGILSMSVICREVLHWLFSVNVSIWLLSVSTGLPDHGLLSNEKSPARNLQTTFDMFSQSHHLDTLHNFFFFFFCFSARFYLSWNNKPWYTKNVACFLPSLILM